MYKGGWSANKIRKQQIRKFADVNNLLEICGPTANLAFADLLFADLILFVICAIKFPQVHK